MNINLFNQRIKNIVDSMDFREPERVPVGFDYLNWPWAMTGTTLENEIEDPEQCAEKYCSFMDEISFDFTMNSGDYESYNAFAALGSEKYTLCSDRCTVQHNQALYHYMEDEEYPLFIDDYHYFKNEYWPKRNIPAFSKSKEDAYRMLKEAAKCVRDSNEFKRIVAEKAVRDHSILVVGMGGAEAIRSLKAQGEFDQGQIDEKYLCDDFVGGMYLSNMDTFFDSYRGMMKTFEDLMDCPDQVDAAMAAMERERIEEMKHMPPLPKVPPHAMPPAMTLYNCECFLSPQQYDKYYFQGMKKALLPLAEAGKKIYLKGEGKFKHTIEYLKEFPKGSIIVQIDDDDPQEMKKLIGDYHTICSGMKTALYAIGDVKKCKDHVKRSFDTLAPGGGFLFYQDKPLLSPADGDPEVVKEVMAFVNECAGK